MIKRVKDYFLSSKAKIGRNVHIGLNTVIHDYVEIGDNTIIGDNCSIGEPMFKFYKDPTTYQNPETIIGANSLVRSFTIIYAGSTFGENLTTGHRVTIREHTTVGNNCSIGTLTDIQGRSEIGNYCRIHSSVFIAEFTKLGNFVFIYPKVTITNDPLPPSNENKGPTVGDYTQICAGSIIMPQLKIGKLSMIGAGSLVTKDVEDDMLVLGSPAKVVGRLSDFTSKKNEVKHYPWMDNFERGMPWEGIGYNNWKLNNL